jgi:hypothetical protein
MSQLPEQIDLEGSGSIIETYRLAHTQGAPMSGHISSSYGRVNASVV